MSVLIGFQKLVVMQITAGHFSMQDRFIRKQLVAFRNFQRVKGRNIQKRAGNVQ